MEASDRAIYCGFYIFEAMILSDIFRKLIHKKNRIDKIERMPTEGGTPFNWKHLPNERLYQDNEYAIKAIQEGADLCGYTAAGNHENVLYHCYWYGQVGRKQIFSIKSFLCTQNLERCKLILWLDADNGFEGYENNELLKPLLPFITIKAFNPATEIMHTPWKRHIKLINHGGDLAKRSDSFRFIILYNYGGLYFDLDVMFLKDFDGLLNQEFCYAWEKQPYANSAILNLNAKSKLAANILKKCIDKGTVLPWVILNYADPSLTNMYVLPCAFFDPLWQGVGAMETPVKIFEDFFKEFDNDLAASNTIRSYQEFFPGCYAYHWHNLWKTPEHDNSYFGIFDDEFSRLLKLK